MKMMKVDEAKVCLEQAQAYWQSEQWQETIQACAKALALNQRLAKAHKLMGDALQKTDKPKEAVGYYGQAIAIEPDYVEVYANLGTVYAKQKQWDQAIGYYEQALKINPEFVEVYRHLAKVWQLQEQPEKAQFYLIKVNELEAQSKDTNTINDYLSRGKTLQQQGELKAALEQYLHAVEFAPQRLETYQEIVVLCKQLELWAEAARYCRIIFQLTNSTTLDSHQPSSESIYLPQATLESNPISIEPSPNLSENKPYSAISHCNLGSLYAGQQEWDKAIYHYQQAIALDPGMAKAYRNLGRALAKVGDQEKSSQYWLQAISLENTGVSATEYLELGNNLASWGKHQPAITCYNRAIESQPDLIAAYLGLGGLLSKSGAKEQAIACYLKGLKYDQNNPELYYRLGNLYVLGKQWSQATLCYQKVTIYSREYTTVYHELGEALSHLENWTEAVSAYRQAIKLNPGFSWSYNNLGYALIQLEQWSEAITIYHQAIKLNPDFPWAYYNLAEAYGKLDQWEQAVIFYRKATEIQPDLPKIQQKLGDALYRRSQQDQEQALKNFQLAIEQDPDNPEVYHQALAIDKNNLELYAKLGDILVESGEIDQGIATYQMALQIQPKNTDIIPRLQETLLKQDPNYNLGKINTVQNNSSTPQQELPLNQDELMALAAELQQILPHSDFPEVSIIIPVYNQLSYTLKCLKAIALNVADKTKVEIILVNDCSTDQTQDVLEPISAIKLIDNPSNQGFIHSCNKGASFAEGKYLYFLNNDTEIKPNCIESLIEVLVQDEQVGAVGSKLIYPQGSLQEAGGIIWQDASGWNYGRQDNPHAPEYNYLRPVDYCSGASLMVRQEIFEELKGFERDFAPAYYEDTDLCFAIRHQLDLKVVYQPKSEVVHYEGITSGTSTNNGVKQYQVVNAAKFKKKWETALTDNYLPNADITNVPLATRKYLGNKTILVIDSYMPCYDKESGSRRLFQLLEIFKSLNYHVIFAADNGVKDEPYTSMLQNLQIEVLYTQQGYGKPIEQQIKERLSVIDLAWICRPELNEKYAPLIRQKQEIKIIYDTIDLHYLRLKRAWELELDKNPEAAKQWIDMQAKELKIAHQSDLTITVTKVEQEILQHQAVDNVAVIPNIHIPYPGNIPGFEQRSGILFIGSYNHPPNIDAVLWLCQEIMPLVWQKRPDIKVTLLGSNPSPEVTALASDLIDVTGYIDDVTPYFLIHKLSVSPLRYGAGMKGKIGHSLEFSLPVVSTEIGIEGMNMLPNQDILLGNNTKEFADQILRIYDNETLWNRLSLNSSRAIANYTHKKVKQSISKLMEQLNSCAK